MSVNVAPVTLRNLLKLGVVGLVLRRNGPLQAYAQPSAGLAMQATAQSSAPRPETDFVKIDGNENPLRLTEQAIGRSAWRIENGSHAWRSLGSVSCVFLTLCSSATKTMC